MVKFIKVEKAAGYVGQQMASPKTAIGRNRRTLQDIDQEFEQLGCLGHGGFGSVFLARKQSGRKVALKFSNVNDDEEERYDIFTRELDALVKLNPKENKSLAIVHFEEWFAGPGFACIVMNYVDGGTLGQEISAKTEPYTERRIAWYALQISEALAFAHERGVAHHDVKSSNVLIDRAAGGKLLLADFGSAVAPGEESIFFTEIYASPELLHMRELDDYSGLEADKVDAFGLGCILFELLCCRKIVDLTDDKTLAEFIEQRGVEDALDLPCIQLPWLESSSSTSQHSIGYSNALRHLVKSILEPHPSIRWTPSQLQKPFREDPRSPLLAFHVVAAQPPVPGAAVTVDNIQLGMFVQRGRDWDDGDADGGGNGRIGVVIKLDADAGYTEVIWPGTTESICCRIGESNKYELQVGPTPRYDFFSGTGKSRPLGIVVVESVDISKYYFGQRINSYCVVVGIQPNEKLIMVAPTEPIPVPTLPPPQIVAATTAHRSPRKPSPPPDSWDTNNDSGIILVDVTDHAEQKVVLDLVYSIQGGLKIETHELLSVKRIQSIDLWEAYSCTREEIAAENWGVANEQKLFISMHRDLPSRLLAQNPGEFFQNCISGDSNDFRYQEIRFSKHSSYFDNIVHNNGTTGESEMVLSRVALGRVQDQKSSRGMNDALNYHSQKKASSGARPPVLTIRNLTQAFPEYIITYKSTLRSPNHNRRIVSARRPHGFVGSNDNSPRSRAANSLPDPRAQRANDKASAKSTGNSPPKADAATMQSKTAMEKRVAPLAKMCVVCLDKPVCRLLVPCGHPCLCQVCSTEQGLKKLRRKCPECRSAIRETVVFYGKVMMNE